MGGRRRALRVTALPRRRGLRREVRISLQPRGPFSLDGPFVAALTDDGGDVVAFRAVRTEDGSVYVDFVSTCPARGSRAHAARILSLDVDASGCPRSRARPGRRAATRGAGGRRPVCFGTPFEAAVWAVLSQRVAMEQARRVKEALAAELGTRMEIGGEEAVAFPGPASLASLDEFPGLWPRSSSGSAGWPRRRRRASSTRASSAASSWKPRPPTSSRCPASAPSEPRSSSRAEPATPTSLRRRCVASARRSRRPTACPRSPDDTTLAQLSEAWRPYRAWITYLLRSASPD